MNVRIFSDSRVIKNELLGNKSPWGFKLYYQMEVKESGIAGVTGFIDLSKIGRVDGKNYTVNYVFVYFYIWLDR